MSHNYRLEATYQDGFVYSQNENDQSLFDEGRNCFYDVVNKLLEPEHGKLVNWAVISQHGLRYDLDMRSLPDNARVILYRDMEKTFLVAGNDIVDENDATVAKWVFGAQYNDENGKNHQIKEELDL